MEQQNFEVKEVKDVYERVPVLGDALNELAKNIIIEDELIRTTPMDSIEQRYIKRKAKFESDYASMSAAQEGSMKEGKEKNALFENEIDDAIKNNPEKIARMNSIITMLNKTQDITEYKRGANELTRLARGKNAVLLYNEPEADPDLLEL
jgi:hypothetical protein